LYTHINIALYEFNSAFSVSTSNIAYAAMFKIDSLTSIAYFVG
jgi:hypothetical protein